MKTALTVIILLSLSIGLAAQTAKPPAQPKPAQSAPPAGDPPNLNAILGDLQRVSQATNGDLAKLRIERWKTDPSEKDQMQKMSESLQRNLAQAVPALIGEVRTTPGSVAKAFKLYHDLNVVYEYLDSLSQAAGSFGKKEEYDPLANDATGLDQARQKLSDYVEQVASTMETQLKKPEPPPKTAQVQPAQTTPRKIIIDDDSPPPPKKKKKTSTAPATSTATPPQ